MTVPQCIVHTASRREGRDHRPQLRLPVLRASRLSLFTSTGQICRSIVHEPTTALGSWMTEPATWPARVESRRPEQRSIAFPPGITVEGATPKTRGGKVARGLVTFPPARGAPAPKNTGSLSPLPPPPVRRHDPPCEARTPWRGTARRVTVADWGNPRQPLSNADSRAQPGPQRRGLCPVRV